MRRSIVYSDPLNDDFAINGIKKKPLPENYRYLPKGAARRGAAFVLHHFVAVPIVFACQKLCYREHIVNRRALKPYLSDGVFCTATIPAARAMLSARALPHFRADRI